MECQGCDVAIAGCWVDSFGDPQARALKGIDGGVVAGVSGLSHVVPLWGHTGHMEQ